MWVIGTKRGLSRRVYPKNDNNEFSKNCRGDQNEKTKSIGIVFNADLLPLV